MSLRLVSTNTPPLQVDQFLGRYEILLQQDEQPPTGGALQPFYEAVRETHAANGPLVDKINGLEAEGFISPRYAILLKNNLHNSPFAHHVMLLILRSLKQEGKLSGAACAQLQEFVRLPWSFLRNPLDETVDYLTAIMLLRQVHPEQNAEVVLQQPLPQLQITIEQLAKKHALARVRAELGKLHSRVPAALKEPLAFAINELASSRQDPAQLRAHLLRFIQLGLLNTEISYVEKMCWKQIGEQLVKLPAEQTLNCLYHYWRTESFYTQCLALLQAARQEVEQGRELNQQTTQKCQRIYQACSDLLADHRNIRFASPIRFAQFYGEINRELRIINQLTRGHHFCSCHLSERSLPALGSRFVPVQSRSASQLTASASAAAIQQEPTVAIFSCGWGGGHKSTATAIGQFCQSHQMHPLTIDLPDDVFSREDILQQSFGRLNKLFAPASKWTIGSLFNFLMQNRAYALINFLRVIGGINSSPTLSERKLLLVLERVLMMSPDALISTYNADNEYLIYVAERLGLPLTHIATDMDTSVLTRSTPPTHPSFKMVVPFKENTRCLDNNAVSRDQVVALGPTVRAPFLRQSTPDEIAALKRKWKVQEGKKVVVVANGSFGGFSPYPQLLAEANRTDIHLVVLCGKNEALKKRMGKLARETRMPISPQAVLDDEAMAEVLTLAAETEGALVGKAGGATLFECVQLGTKILVPDLDAGTPRQWLVALLDQIAAWLGYPTELAWEAENIRFIETHQMGQVVRDADPAQLLSALDGVLKKPKPHMEEVGNFQVGLYQLMSEMLQPRPTAATPEEAVS